MPDDGAGVSRQATRVIQAVAELADGGLAERMQVDAGVRLLVSARRLSRALPRPGVPSAAERVVSRITRGWDPAATTAAEYLETLPLAEFDAFIEAGPVWAAEQRDRAMPKATQARRAA